MFWPRLLLGIFYFSLNEATAYVIARARPLENAPDGEDAEIDLTARAGLALNLVASVITTALCLAATPFVLGNDRADNLDRVLQFSALWIPLALIDLYFNAVCQARYKVLQLNILRLCQPAVYAVALLALLLARRLTVESVLVAGIASLGISAALGLYFEGIRRPTWDPPRFMETIRAALRLHGVNVLLYVAAEVDKFVVIRWMSDSDAGIYAVALAVSVLGSSVVVQSFSVLAYPRIAAIQDRASQTEVICEFSQLSLVLLSLVNGAAAVLSPFLIPIVFGAGFAAAVPATVILLAANTLRGMRQVIDRTLRSVLDVVPGMSGESVGLAAFVALAPIGLYYGGLPGVACAMLGSQALALAVTAAMTARRRETAIRKIFGWRNPAVHRLARALWREYSPWRNPASEAGPGQAASYDDASNKV
jgi:O-antigen/teichoic acid export membrane protein